ARSPDPGRPARGPAGDLPSCREHGRAGDARSGRSGLPRRPGRSPPRRTRGPAGDHGGPDRPAGRSVRDAVHRRAERSAGDARTARSAGVSRPEAAGRVLVLAACLALAGPAASCRTPHTDVRVGSKKFTESVVLGEILTGMMRDAGVRAEHRAQLGGTQILWHALLQGDIDLYPDYTGTLRADILRHLPDDSEETLRAALARLDVGMSGSLGFEDRYALGMKSGEARRLGLTRLSDLGAHPRLRCGFSEEFLNRADG